MGFVTVIILTDVYWCSSGQGPGKLDLEPRGPSLALKPFPLALELCLKPCPSCAIGLSLPFFPLLAPVLPPSQIYSMGSPKYL